MSPLLGILSSGGLAPGAPTIGTATDGGTGTTASVAFTAPSYLGKGSGTVTYTATSSPGSLTGTATSSPITVSGLTTGTAYTFTVKATTSYGVTGASSAASNSVTPATPSSFESISTITLGSTGGVSFTSIPSTYKHLQLRCSLIGNDASLITVRYNGDTGSNYARHWIFGDGTNIGLNGEQNMSYWRGGVTPTSGTTTTIFTPIIIDILDYASTSKYKTGRSFMGFDLNGAWGQGAYLLSGLWVNSSAINQIDLNIQTGNGFIAGSVFSLYGIKG